ncbi:MAG: ATP-binding cassette domain-containing protein, partial [Candidatus Adiutrix sp.]
MLQLENLHVRYGGIHAVQGVDIKVPKGDIVTLVGANGAGKSSIVRAISGLVQKGVSGAITYAHKKGQTFDLTALRPEQIVKCGLALSPEGRRILPHLTVAEN